MSIGRKIQLLWRRIIWGFSESDLWDLYITHAEWILPRLEKFKEIQHGFPADLTQEQWDNILDKIIFAFIRITEGEDETNPMVRWGLDLFREYYFHLWD